MRDGEGKVVTVATCFIARYQQDKLYVNIVVEAAADLQRQHSCWHPYHDYFDDVDIYTLLAEHIYYL
jgi:hypothetical protein